MQINNYLNTINKWKNCPMANYVCPVARYSKLETNTPRGKAFILSLIVNNIEKLDEVAVERIYQCDLCRACEAISRDDSSIPELILAARRDIVNLNMIPEKVEKLKEDIVNNTNLLDSKWTEDKALELKSSSNTIIVVSYESENAKKTYLKIKYLLEGQNINCVELNIGKYSSPISMLNELGYYESSQKALKNLVYLLQKIEIKKVVFLTPYDLEFLIRNERNFKESNNLIHAFELLKEYIETARIKTKEQKEEMIYFDAGCYRDSNKFYDIPRDILKMVPGLKLREMIWIGKESISCGGLTLPYIYPEIFNGIINVILEEIKNYNLNKIIIPCPHCIDNFNANSDIKENYKVLDLWDVVV